MDLRGLSNLAATSQIFDNFELDFDGEAPRSNMPISSSSEDKDVDSQTSEAHEGQKDNQMAVLGDIKVLFNEDQELPVNIIQVSNCNSNFICNRDISTPQPITVIHPITHDLEIGESVEGKQAMKEAKKGALVEVGAYAEWGQQLTEHETE